MTRLIYISGAAGVGKSLLGRSLATTLDVPAVELGVLVRLIALARLERSGTKSARELWSWLRRERLDFDGLGALGLAATVPRLDGRVFERELWLRPTGAELTELAASPIVQEVLDSVSALAIARGAGVVIGRVPAHVSKQSAFEIELVAEPLIRQKRKLRQLSAIGASPEQRLYDPPSLLIRAAAPVVDLRVDTSHVSPEAVFDRVTACLAGKRDHSAGSVTAVA